MTYAHEPVLLDEVVHYLRPKPGQRFIDCTLGGGGHTAALAKRIAPDGSILGIDLDPSALQAAKASTKQLPIRVTIAQGNFKDLRYLANQHGFQPVNGILIDLGLSSLQLQDKKRGFSFLADGRPDMRCGPEQTQTAAAILNDWSEDELTALFKNFGEEPLAKPIARAIVEQRNTTAIENPRQLLEIIIPLYHRRYHKPSKHNPATRVFQALRIAVNDELENLRQVLPQAVGLLTPGGRLGVISYHSLEDRIVKNYFRQESRDCICPPALPQCQCQHRRLIRLVSRKPVVPTEAEVTRNPRSRSAKLRVIEKIS